MNCRIIVLLYFTLLNVSEGCTITFKDHGSYRKTQSYYLVLLDYSKELCTTACSKDHLCTGFGYNAGSASCFKSSRSDSMEAAFCGECSFHSKICNLGCTVDYFDHGYYTEPQDKSVILSSPSSSPDTCRGMCTLDISCSGFSFNKLTAECQLSQLSNPKSSLCSSCFFHSKRCTSAPDLKTLPVSSTTISTTPVKSTSKLFTKPTISMTKFYTTESSSTMSNVKPSLVTSAISKSINTNTADVKHFSYITNGRSTFERNYSNINNNKTEMVKFQITTASSVKPSTTDIGTSTSLDKSTDISNVRLTSNITPQPTTDVRNTTPIALTFTSSNTYSHSNAIKVYTQTSQSPNNTRIVQSSQFSDRIFQNTTTSNQLQTFTTAFSNSPLNFTNAVSTADVQMTSVNNQINNSTPRILCSCSCRETESNLDQLILQRKKELKMEVKTLSITKRKYISVSDPRTSSKAVGFLGILILCLFGALIVATDLINLIPKTSKILPTNTSS